MALKAWPIMRHNLGEVQQHDIFKTFTADGDTFQDCIKLCQAVRAFKKDLILQL